MLKVFHTNAACIHIGVIDISGFSSLRVVRWLKMKSSLNRLANGLPPRNNLYRYDERQLIVAAKNNRNDIAFSSPWLAHQSLVWISIYTSRAKHSSSYFHRASSAYPKRIFGQSFQHQHHSRHISRILLKRTEHSSLTSKVSGISVMYRSTDISIS